MFSDGESVASKAKDPRGTIKKLMHYLEPHKVAISISLLLALLSTAFAVAGPRMLGWVITALVDGMLAHMFGTGLLTNFRYMGTIITWLVILYVFSAVAQLVQGLIMAKVTMRVTYKLRNEISEKMHRLPMNFFDTQTKGDILSRITNDIETMSGTLNQSLTQLITSSTTIIGVLIMMVWISPIMTLASLIIIPLSMSVMMLVLGKSYIYFGKQQESLGTLNGIIEETYSGHSVVKAYNAETDAEEKFEEVNGELKHSAKMAQFLSGLLEPIFMLVGNLGYVVVSVMGGILVIQRAITIGDVQAFIQYIMNFTSPLGELGASSNMMQSTIAASERVFEFLEEEEEVAETTDCASKDVYHGKVSFRNVQFGYNEDKIIINDISQEITPGQTVAIVGPTGAGKTTIVKLLMRFYELNKGNILIDDIDSTDFSRKELRDIFGMVLQDTWLYNATVMDNIRYGSPHATDEEVIRAAKAAHCHEFIRTLPGGYNMVLDEEASNISQGQKQLFTIARVLLKDPAILILDEATSSIDTRTEILIQQAMQEAMNGRTSFVIAHRLSTIRDADIILVMKDGDIIEKGNHNELLAQNGFYADLYNSQFEESEDVA